MNEVSSYFLYIVNYLLVLTATFIAVSSFFGKQLIKLKLWNFFSYGVVFLYLIHGLFYAIFFIKIVKEKNNYGLIDGMIVVLFILSGLFILNFLNKILQALSPPSKKDDFISFLRSHPIDQGEDKPPSENQ